MFKKLKELPKKWGKPIITAKQKTKSVPVEITSTDIQKAQALLGSFKVTGITVDSDTLGHPYAGVDLSLIGGGKEFSPGEMVQLVSNKGTGMVLSH